MVFETLTTWAELLHLKTDLALYKQYILYKQRFVSID